MADTTGIGADAAPSEKLSVWTKAAYAIGDLGEAVGPGTIIPFWYLYFLTDVIEVDELMSGKRQEGIYSGVNVFAQKLATGIVLGIVGPLMAWSGYVEGTETQSETAITTIRLLMGLLPAFFLTLACVVAWYYPLTRKRHTEMLEKLALRRSRKGIEND